MTALVVVGSTARPKECSLLTACYLPLSHLLYHLRYRLLCHPSHPLRQAHLAQLAIETRSAAEVREQASCTLKALNDARVGLEGEARGHHATQTQLLELHQVLQKERDFYLLEMQADRELKVRLDATQAELAATRKVLDETRFSKDEQLVAVQRTHELQKQQLLHAAANAREANLSDVLSRELAHYKHEFLQDRERLHAEVAEERRLLQTHLSSKTEAMRHEADARVNALTLQLDERLEEAKRIHAAQLTVLTAHYDSLVRHPVRSH